MNNKNKIREKICIALDVDSGAEALRLSGMLKNYCGFFKIGVQLFSQEGPDIVKKVISLGPKVFLDLKYHDIPNTIKNTVKVIVGLGISVFNVHTTGGYEMMLETSNAVKEESKKLGIPKPMAIGVTVLTSINSKILSEELMIKQDLSEYVVHLSKLAKKAGLDGVVASPHEIKIIRKSCGPNFKIITPGVRPSWSLGVDDQKRIMTPNEAIKNGADFIVVGRPIIKAKDPVEAAKKLLNEILS
ncbi:MAG: orotidine-5'-phosphate decarboxylase [Thermodesulfobacteriota bacterium]|jgi:orotidine-5'-phosphate decarboxylase